MKGPTLPSRREIVKLYLFALMGDGVFKSNERSTTIISKATAAFAEDMTALAAERLFQNLVDKAEGIASQIASEGLRPTLARLRSWWSSTKETYDRGLDETVRRAKR